MRALISVIILAAIGGGIWWWYPDSVTYSYQTVDVGQGKVERQVISSGTLGAVTTVEVGSEVSGQITKLYADYNDEVTEGQLIAQLNDSSYQARVSQLEADLAMAQAALGEKEAGVIKANANLSRSYQDYKRLKSLVGKNYSSQSEVDTAWSEYKVAQAEVEVAKAQVVSANAYIIQKQASLDEAKVNLSETRILSPISGVILNRLVSEGQTVAASMTTPVLFEIAGDLSRMQIEAFIDEADIGQVKEQQKVRFTVDAWPEKNFVGQVTQVRKAATDSSAVVTYTVVISVNNDSQILLPGMTANTEIITESREDVPRIPNSALRFQPPQAQETASTPTSRILNNLASLQLTDEQKAAIEAEIDTEQPKSSMMGAGGASQARTAMKNRLANVMRKILTPEQLQQYKAMQSSRQKSATEGKQETIWILDQNGQVQSVTIFTGLQDDEYTEVVGGRLNEGDHVIISAQKR